MFAPSSSASADIIDLVDDEDYCNSPALPTAVLSSSPSADIPSTSNDPFNITSTSQHVFGDYQAMCDYLDKFGAECGFELRYPSNKGTPGQPGHAGTARCWCWQHPPLVLKPEEQQHPSHPPQRTVVSRGANRSGNQVKCGCTWRINFTRRANGEYGFTSTRHLQHTGHECVAPNKLAVMIDSLRVVPEAVQQDVLTAVLSGLHGVEPLRRFLATKHKLELNRVTFTDLVQRTKSQLGIRDARADFAELVTWLQKEMRDGTAVARINIEDGATVSGIFYMSAEMLHHSRRNSQVLMMDTTFNTNRFSWPLCLLCGVDEHNHTVILSIALLRYQTTDAFEWVLQQLRSAMPDEAWASVSCVFTDGDQAMAAALASTLPHAHHLRCRYHLKQNLRGKLHRAGVDPVNSEKCIKEWETATCCETEEEFNAAIAALLNNYPSIRQYITDSFPAGRLYADFSLNHITTFGIRTTARVESWNATLKGMLEVDSRTAMSVLFQTLQYALSDKDARSFKKALEDTARRPPNTQARTIDAETAPHLTYYAQCVVKTQASLVANYKFEMVQALNPAVFNVFDRRPIGEEKVRQVTITETSMQCTCGFPLSYLLPCRHVLVVNNHIYNSQFRVSQVAKRWLRAHMPAVRDQSARFPYLPPMDVSVPSFSSTVPAPQKNLPARQGRWGQIMGWCTTIASIATENGELYGFIAKKVEALCKEVEGLVSKPAAAPERLSTAVSANSTAPSAVSELHPSVSVEQMQMPPHRKRKRGKGSEKRQESAVELTSRGAYVGM
jgi:MULE transposase domain